MRDLQTVDLADLIPSSIASDPQVQAAVQALNGELQACTAQIEQVRLISRIDELDSDTLDQLAWHYNVLFYDTGYTLTQKRGAIKRAIYWRRIAGTKGAVTEALSALLYTTKITEWFEEGGDPYTFSVEVESSQNPFTENAIAELARVIDVAKNVRSHYTFDLVGRTDCKFYLGAATVCGDVVEILPA